METSAACTPSFRVSVTLTEQTRPRLKQSEALTHSSCRQPLRLPYWLHFTCLRLSHPLLLQLSNILFGQFLTDHSSSTALN
jgi:hypothetical protein